MTRTRIALSVVVALVLPTYPVQAQRSTSQGQGQEQLTAARALLGRGNLEAAAAAFQQALRTNPNLEAAHQGLTSVYFLLKRYQQGAQAARRGLKQVPGSTLLRGQLGMHLCKLNQLAEARANLESALDANKDRVDLLAMAAQCCLRARAPACTIKATTLYLSRRPSRLAPKDLVFLVILARAHLMANQTSKAREAAQQALRRQPGYAAALAVLAEAQLRGGQCQPAVSNFLALRRQLPASKFVSFQLNLARAHVCAGQPRAALTLLRAALQRAPHDHALRLLEADALFGAGEHQRALQQYRQLLPGAKNPVEIRLRLARTLERIGQRRRALQEFEAAVQVGKGRLPPGEASGLLGIRLAMGNRRRALAVRYAQQALDALPRSKAIFLLAAKAYFAAQKTKESLDIARRGLKLAPRDPALVHAAVRALLHLAYSDVKAKRFDLSLSKLKEAQALAPTSLPVNRNLALLSLRAGRPRHALAFINKVLHRVPYDAIANRIAGRAQFALGDLGKAQQHFSQAVQGLLRHGGLPLAQALGESAATHIKAGRDDQAQVELSRAYTLSTHVASADPLRAAIARMLVELFTRRAQRALATHKPAEAYGLLQQARGFASQLPKHDRARVEVFALWVAASAGKSKEAQRLLGAVKASIRDHVRPVYRKVAKPLIEAYLLFLSPAQRAKQNGATKLAAAARRAPKGVRAQLRRVAASAYEQLGLAQARAGNAKAALRSFQQVKKLAPRFPHTAAQRHNLVVTTYLAKKRRGNLALAQLASTVPTAWCNMAVQEEQRGRHKEALAHYQKCRDAGGTFPRLAEIIAKKRRLFGTEATR